jgi:hypothetical protein
MAATTVLGPGGYPRPPYGNFAGKVAAGVRSTVLGPGGYPRPPYATAAFTTKVPAMGSGGEGRTAFFSRLLRGKARTGKIAH